MNHFLDLLHRLDRERSTAPLLTWYGADGRVELSGRVYANWVIKTANLLQDECDLTPGDTISLPPQPHWKTLIIGHAALALGMRIIRMDAADAAKVAVVPDSPELPGDAETYLTVALPPLAVRCQHSFDSAVDWNAEVRSQSDMLLYVPPVNMDVEFVPGFTLSSADDWRSTSTSDSSESHRWAQDRAMELDSIDVLKDALTCFTNSDSLVLFENAAKDSDLHAERARRLVR